MGRLSLSGVSAVKSYGDIIISTPEAIPHALSISFGQCHSTWVALGRPDLLSLMFKDWPSDEGCMWPDGLGLAPHGSGPHHHYAWKFTVDD